MVYLVWGEMWIKNMMVSLDAEHDTMFDITYFVRTYHWYSGKHAFVTLTCCTAVGNEVTKFFLSIHDHHVYMKSKCFKMFNCVLSKEDEKFPYPLQEF